MVDKKIAAQAKVDIIEKDMFHSNVPHTFQNHYVQKVISSLHDHWFNNRKLTDKLCKVPFYVHKSIASHSSLDFRLLNALCGIRSDLIHLIQNMTFVPVTIAPMIHANVKRNPNPNPNPKPYPTPNQKPNHYTHSNSLLSEISSQEQLSPEQMSDHPDTVWPRLSSHQFYAHLYYPAAILQHYVICVFINFHLKYCSKQNENVTFLFHFLLFLFHMNHKIWQFVRNTAAMSRYIIICINAIELAVPERILHVWPNCLSRWMRIPTWLGNWGLTVLLHIWGWMEHNSARLFQCDQPTRLYFCLYFNSPSTTNWPASRLNT